MAGEGAYVLVADDDADVRNLVIELMQRVAPDLEVRSAVDGGIALRMIHGERPVLLVLDLVMPVIDGLGVLEALRARPETRDLPVALMSATAGTEVLARAEELGIVGFLNKPAQPLALTRQLASWLGRSGVSVPSVPSGAAPAVALPPAKPSQVSTKVLDPNDDGQLVLGRMVGEYVVGPVLARGGMGAVYRGEHPRIGKRVAIKVLDAEMLKHPGMARRFLDEARAVNRIRHPNLVDVFGFGELEDGRPYLVMDLLEGPSLRKLLEAKTARPEELAEVVAQVCDALEATHRAGILHRDLKPENVVVVKGAGGRTEARLLDFGVAKILDSIAPPDTARTGLGLAIGTPRYMAPEQFRMAELGPATDIYAIGLVLHEVLAGTWPFDASTPAEHMRAHTELPPRIDPTLAQQWPDAATLVRECLAKDPKARPETAGVVASRIRRAFVRPVASAARGGSARVAPRVPVWAIVVGATALAALVTLALALS